MKLTKQLPLLVLLLLVSFSFSNCRKIKMSNGSDAVNFIKPSMPSISASPGTDVQLQIRCHTEGQLSTIEGEYSINGSTSRTRFLIQNFFGYSNTATFDAIFTVPTIVNTGDVLKIYIILSDNKRRKYENYFTLHIQ